MIHDDRSAKLYEKLYETYMLKGKTAVRRYYVNNEKYDNYVNNINLQEP